MFGWLTCASRVGGDGRLRLVAVVALVVASGVLGAVLVAGPEGAAIAGTVSADQSERVVAADGSGDYETIQDAVNDSSPGETVVVEDGTYVESVTVDIEDLDIVAADGHEPVMEGDGELGPALRLDANGITVDGFEIREYDLGDASSSDSYMIDVQADGATIENTKVYDNTDVDVVVLVEGNDATLSNVTVANNTGIDDAAVYAHYFGTAFEIHDSTVVDNDDRGLYVFQDDATVANSNVSRNGERGIGLRGLEGIDIYGNTISDNAEEGIYQLTGPSSYDANGVNATDNSISGNGEWAIWLAGGSDAVIEDNEILENGGGISVADGATVTNNTIADSANLGMHVDVGGIEVGPGSTVADNEISNVEGEGISAGDGSLVVDNEVDASEWAVRPTNMDDVPTVESLDIGASTAPNTVLSLETHNVLVGSVDDVPPNDDAEAIGRYFETDLIGIHDGDHWLDISIGYTDDDATSVDEETLAIHQYDEDAGEWVALDSTVETDAGTVSANVTTFDDPVVETFGVFGEEATQEGGVFDVDIDATNAPVTEGETLSVDVSVLNVGAERDTQLVELEYDDEVVDDESVTVGTDQSQSVTLEWETAAGDAGDREIVVRSEDDVDGTTVQVEEASGPVVSVTDTDAGAIVDVTGAAPSEPTEIPLDGAVGIEEFELETLTITTTEDGDYDLEIEADDELPADIDRLPTGSALAMAVDVNASLEDHQIETATFRFGADPAEDLDPRDRTVYHAVEDSWSERETATLFPGDMLDAETAEDLFPGDHMDEAGVENPDALFPEETIAEAETADEFFPGDMLDRSETVDDLFPGDHMDEAGVEDPKALFPDDVVASAETVDDLFPGDHLADAETVYDLFPGDHLDDAGVEDPEALFPSELVSTAETADELFPGDTLDRSETVDDLFPGDHMDDAGVEDPEALFPTARIAAAESADELFPGDHMGETAHVATSPHFSAFALAADGGHFDVIEIAPAHAEVDPGVEFDVDVVVENAGTADDETDVEVHVDGELARTVEGVHVDAGETTVVTVENVAAPSVAGSYPLTVSTEDDVEIGTLTVGEAPVFNVDQGTSHHTIQDGVDDAEAGDTLELANETFEEDVLVTTDNLTIRAAGDRPTIVGGFEAESLDLTVRGLKITGGYQDGAGIEATTHRPGSSPGAAYDLTIDDAVITDTGAAGISARDYEVAMSDVVVAETGVTDTDYDAAVFVAGAGNVTIVDADVGDSAGAGVRVDTALDVVIQDIDVSDVDHYGVRIEGAGDASIDNVSADGVAVGHGIRVSRGIQIHDAGDVAVSGTTVENVSQRGVQIADADSVTVSDVAVEGSGSGYAVGVYGVTGPVTISEVEVNASGTGVWVAGSDTVTVTDAEVQTSFHGLRFTNVSEVTVEDSQLVDGTYGLRINATEVATVENSVIEGNDVGLQNERNSTEIDARYNWWGAEDGPGGEGPGDGDPVYGNVLVEPWLDDAPPDGSEVGDIPVYNVDQDSAHATIQNAVSAAEPGDTLHLDDRTFEEDVWVGPADLTIEAAQERPTVEGGFVIMGSNATVRGLEITGGYEGGVGIQTADHRGNRDLTVEDTEIRATGSSGIHLPDPGEITITDVTIEHTGETDDGPGIRVTQAADVTIEDVVVQTVDHYGITIEGANDVTIEDAVVDDVDISHPYRRSRGIQIHDAGDVAVSGTTIGNVTQLGVGIVGAESATVSDVAVEGTGVAVDTADVTGPVAVSAVEVNASGTGVRVTAPDGVVTVSDVDARAVGTGVRIDDADEALVGESAVVDAEFYGIVIEAGSEATVEGSHLEGNDVGLLNRNNATEIDARHNWWGSPAGPGGDGPGDGDPVYGNVLVEPWLELDSEGTPVPGHGFAGIVHDDRALPVAAQGVTDGNDEPVDGTLTIQLRVDGSVVADREGVTVDDGDFETTIDTTDLEIDVADVPTGEAEIVLEVEGERVGRTGTVHLVHEAYDLDDGYTRWSIPQPAEVYLSNGVLDVTQWDTANATYVDVGFGVNDGSLVTGAVDLHRGLYVNADGTDERIGYDFAEPGQAELPPGGTETIEPGWNLLSSNYDASTGYETLNLDLNTVSSLPANVAEYEGNETMVAHDPRSFVRLGGDEVIEPYDTYWIYLDVTEESETRAIGTPEYDPGERVAVLDAEDNDE